MESFDIIVMGAGPSGAVAASYLARLNYRVIILEKETFPRFVIGESLLPCCMEFLDEAGLLEAVKEKGFQIKSGAAFHREDKRCEFFFDDQYTKGWTWTWQVKRAEFDQTLAEQAQKNGADLRYGSEVIAVSCSSEKQIVQYRDNEGVERTIEGRFIIDASGYGRVLPRLFDLGQPSKFKARGALFSHFIDSKRTPDASANIFVHSFNNNASWIWAIPFSDGTTSVGIVGDQEYIVDMASDGAFKFKEFIRTFKDLNGRFVESSYLFEPRTILGYSVGVKSTFGDGYVLAGNSTEFLDPIFSSGVTFATASGMFSAKLIDRQLRGERVNWQTEYEDKLRKGIDVFRTYVAGWYNGDFQTIIFTDSINAEIKKQICSVLAGYVWDETNPFVKKHETILSTLAKVIRINERQQNLNK
jgi:flavin-dependent dehydrogenase